MSIELDESSLARRGSPALYYASAMPSAGAKAVLGIVHGYADHGARYRHVMGALAEHGIGTVTIDLRGHGRALGPRGYCERFGEFLDDARELRRLVKERAKGAPVFLFGHSFGGLVATSSVLESDATIQGLGRPAPFIGQALEVPRVKILAARVASRVYPRLSLPSGLHGKDMSHDPDKARADDTDPLVFPKATARWFTEIVAAQERAISSAPRLKLPLYIAFGTADRVASMTVGKRFFDAAGSADKTWDPREGLYHEILNEPSWKELVEAIARWITSHV